MIRGLKVDFAYKIIVLSSQLEFIKVIVVKHI